MNFLNVLVTLVTLGAFSNVDARFPRFPRWPGGNGGTVRPRKNDTSLGDHIPPFPLGIQFVNDTCTVDPLASPVCTVGKGNMTNGAWVCRTLYNIATGAASTFSACVDTQHFIASDTCGCCDDQCPSIDPCPCACNVTKSTALGNGRGGSSAGVLVAVVGDAVGVTKCVPADISVKMVTGPGLLGRATCVTTC
jgi:hypothetical protein